jgi:hypothetical protein
MIGAVNMLKIILGLLAVFCSIFFGIEILKSMSAHEKWILTKFLIYAIMCSLITIGAVALIIFLF